MLTSQFTQEQNDLIKSYMPDFEAKTLEVDPSLENKSTTKYRQEKTTEIMESEPFAAEGDKKDLRARIMKKFSNHYQEMKRKRGVCGIRRNVADEKPIKLFEETTGRQLFEEARKDDINKEATQRRTKSSSSNHAGHYQAVLKEMWEGMDEDEREKYNKAAQDHSDDVSENQKQFMSVMWKQLKTICQNGKLGHAEMMLLFAFRDQEGDVESGFVSGHSVENNIDMRDFIDDFKERIEASWNKYANHVLPSNVAEEPNSSYPIPRDSSGLPLFPTINIQRTMPDDVVSYCTEYFAALWAHTWSSEKEMPEIPWNEISEHPSRYYDNTTFSFPVKLRAPGLMPLCDIYSIINSLSTFHKAFNFYSKEEVLNKTAVPALEQADGGPSALDKDHGDRVELLREEGESSPGDLQTGETSRMESGIYLNPGGEPEVVTHAAAQSNELPLSKPRARKQVRLTKKSDKSATSAAARSNMPADGSETVTSSSEARVKRQSKPRKRWDDDNGTVASSSKVTTDLKRKAATATGLEKPKKKRQRRSWFAYVDDDGNPCDKDGNPIDEDGNPIN